MQVFQLNPLHLLDIGVFTIMLAYSVNKIWGIEKVYRIIFMPSKIVIYYLVDVPTPALGLGYIINTNHHHF